MLESNIQIYSVKPNDIHDVNAVTIEDVLDEDVEAEQQRIKEWCLPVDSPFLYLCVNDNIPEPTLRMHPVGGKGGGWY